MSEDGTESIYNAVFVGRTWMIAPISQMQLGVSENSEPGVRDVWQIDVKYLSAVLALSISQGFNNMSFSFE